MSVIYSSRSRATEVSVCTLYIPNVLGAESAPRFNTQLHYYVTVFLCMAMMTRHNFTWRDIFFKTYDLFILLA
jgi:hypothetical protein